MAVVGVVGREVSGTEGAGAAGTLKVTSLVGTTGGARSVVLELGIFAGVTVDSISELVPEGLEVLAEIEDSPFLSSSEASVDVERLLSLRFLGC